MEGKREAKMTQTRRKRVFGDSDAMQSHFGHADGMANAASLRLLELLVMRTKFF